MSHLLPVADAHQDETVLQAVADGEAAIKEARTGAFDGVPGVPVLSNSFNMQNK